MGKLIQNTNVYAKKINKFIDNIKIIIKYYIIIEIVQLII